MERREYFRYEFELLAMEHRPDGDPHRRGTRLLHCLDFSQGGMRFRGQPRFKRFRVTLDIPHDNSRVDAEVEVVHRGKDYFGVRFVNPSAELLQKLGYWQASTEFVPQTLPDRR